MWVFLLVWQVSGREAVRPVCLQTAIRSSAVRLSIGYGALCAATFGVQIPVASTMKETLNVYQTFRVLFMQKLWYFMHFTPKERQNVPKSS